MNRIKPWLARAIASGAIAAGVLLHQAVPLTGKPTAWLAVALTLVLAVLSWVERTDRHSARSFSARDRPRRLDRLRTRPWSLPRR